MKVKREDKRIWKTLDPLDLGWLFLGGSIVGFLLEGLWCVVTRGGWENHASVVWGPFCIIYGLGMVIMYLLSLATHRAPILLRFLTFAISGSALEYASSLFQEVVFSSTSWDYTGQLLSLHGRISLKMTLIWGSLGLLFSILVFPHVTKLLEAAHTHGWRIACMCLLGAMLLNLLMSAAAVLRWRERTQNEAPSNAFEEYLDGAFGDERMKKTFSNLKFTE